MGKLKYGVEYSNKNKAYYFYCYPCLLVGTSEIVKNGKRVLVRYANKDTEQDRNKALKSVNQKLKEHLRCEVKTLFKLD